MTDTLSELDETALLAVASGAVRDRRLAEVRDLEVLAQWAAVHSTDPTEGPDGAVARRLGDVLVHPGGEGTPGVQDFCLGEIALARGTGVTATCNALADVLDNVTLGVTVVGAVTLAGGALILVGAVAMTRFQRLYEASIYRTLGASTRMLATMVLVEYSLLGLFASLAGAAALIVHAALRPSGVSAASTAV